MFWAQVIGSFTPRSNRLMSSTQPLQHAAQGLSSTKKIAHRKPIGQPNRMRIISQIMLHSQPQFAMVRHNSWSARTQPHTSRGRQLLICLTQQHTSKGWKQHLICDDTKRRLKALDLPVTDKRSVSYITTEAWISSDSAKKSNFPFTKARYFLLLVL